MWGNLVDYIVVIMGVNVCVIVLGALVRGPQDNMGDVLCDEGQLGKELGVVKSSP